MMLELKRLSIDAVPGALAKAERYRLLNEPANAESICLDILAVEPDNQQALTTLILAMTDQFREEGVGRLMARAKELIPRLDSEYARLYYTAIVYERRARAHVAAGAAALAHDWFAEALRGFGQAMAVRPSGNDEAILRWNACVRALDRLPAPHVHVDSADSAIMSE